MSLALPAPSHSAATQGRFNVVEALEVGFLGFVLALMSSGRVEWMFLSEASAADPARLQTIWAAVYLGVAALAVARALQLVSLILGALLLAPLLVLAFISEAWSIAPPITIHRATALSLTTLFGLLLAARFSWRALMEFLAGVLVILAVGSLGFSLLLPDLGIHSDGHAGAWRGLWFEKNAFGAAMARATLACACAAILAPPRRLFWIGAGVACALLVVMSTSTTALLGLLASLAAVGGLMALRTRGAPAVVTIWLGVVAAALLGVAFVQMPEVFFGAVGKDSTLTGRTDVWGAVLRVVAERPWTGFGYGAFWQVPDGPMADIRAEIDWTAAHAHNGWLELLLAFGWTGLAIFATHFGVTVLAATSRVWGGAEVYWALPSVLLLAVVSVSESTILQQNDGAWVVYVATATKLLQLRFAPHVVSYPVLPPGVEQTRLG